MSDDIIKRLRDAIAAGPTPGPWVVYDDSNDGKTNRIEIVALGKTVARIYRSVPEEDLPNARLIAAASPDNIAALLDRLDAAERENERLRSESKAQLEELDRIDDALGTNEGPSAVDHIVILKTENERLRAENEALTAALQEAIALRVKLYRHSDSEGDMDNLTDRQLAELDAYAKRWQAAIDAARGEK